MPGPADEFVPYRDSVDGADETQVLLQQDAEAAAASAGGSAGPGTPSMQDERIPSHFTIRQAIAASWILFVPSAISLLFGVVTAIMYATDPDNFDLDWETTLALQILALLSFVSVFVSAVNLFTLANARVRNAASPSPLGIFINVVTHTGIGFVFITCTLNILEHIDWSHGGLRSLGVITSLWLVAAILIGWIIVPALLIFWIRGLIIWFNGSGSWSSWSLPRGELRIEASIKFLRQEEPVRDTRESA